MFNKVILIGNLTRNIELRYLANGTAVGSTAIAVTRKFTTQNEKKEETCFIDITFFGRTAEIANQYLIKGSKILIEGRLKFDQWTDSNGQNRTKHTIVVETMEMLGSNNNAPQQNPIKQNFNQQKPTYQASQSNANKTINNSTSESFEEKLPSIDIDTEKYDDDDEIPF